MTWGLGLEWKADGSSFQSVTPLGQASLSSSPSPAIAPTGLEPCQACLRNQPGAREYWMNRCLHLNMNCWPRLPCGPIWPSSPHCNTVSRSNLPSPSAVCFPWRAWDTFARDNHCSHTLLMEDGPFTHGAKCAASHAHSEPGHAAWTSVNASSIDRGHCFHRLVSAWLCLYDRLLSAAAFTTRPPSPIQCNAYQRVCCRLLRGRAQSRACRGNQT